MSKELNKTMSDFVRLCEEGLRELRKTHPIFAAKEQSKEHKAKKIMKRVYSRRRRQPKNPVPEQRTEEKFVLTGEIFHLIDSTYVVDDVQFEIDARTWVFGDIGPGAMVRAVGVLEGSGKNRATRIIVQ